MDLKQIFLRRSCPLPQTSAMLCSRSSAPVLRVLILNQNRAEGARFLDAAIEQCLIFEVKPVVLTVARTEDQAQAREQMARSRFEAQRIAADYDVVVGGDIRTAVARVARWRRCSHVFVERQESPRWWRWFRGDTIHQLLGLSDSLSFLSLPGP